MAFYNTVDAVATPDVLPLTREAEDWLEGRHDPKWRYKAPTIGKPAWQAPLKPGKFVRSIKRGGRLVRDTTPLGDDAHRYAFTFRDDTLHVDRRAGIPVGLSLEDWLEAKHSADWVYVAPTPPKPTAIPRLSAKAKAKLEAEWAFAVAQANRRIAQQAA